jgi:2-phospho-L-lactate/phosphoenolpyruvate guanylyltransferase
VSCIWAVVPVKELAGAKQRLSSCLSPEERHALATIMLEDVLDALSAVQQLAGSLVVTVDPVATSLAGRYAARIVTEASREGHTGAVMAAARLLAREGQAGMMTMPGDIPRLSSAEIAATLAAHRAAPAFTIVPAHDDLGSNTVVCSPPDVVPLRFGEDSFYPHLGAARDRGIDPLIVRQPGIGMDIDNPVDLVTFLRLSPLVPTRTLAFLRQSGIAGPPTDGGPRSSVGAIPPRRVSGAVSKRQEPEQQHSAMRPAAPPGPGRKACSAVPAPAQATG